MTKNHKLFGIIYESVENNWQKPLIEAPRFIDGDFTCRLTHLTTLENCPIEVLGLFDCSHNELKTLEFSPTHTGTFIASNNLLTDLKINTEVINGNLYLEDNPNLTNLSGYLQQVNGDIYLNNCPNLSDNEIRTFLENCIVSGKIYRTINEVNNKIFT